MADKLPRIDHIIIGALDIRVAAKHFLDTYGLGGYEGGKHQGGWGTENYIIPLGQGYIEIAAVSAAAQSCDWGKLIASVEVTEEQPWKIMTFCVQSEEDAAVVSKRLDHMLGHMLRLLPDKRELTWRVAAMSRFHEPERAPQPFFITWDDPSIRPDKLPASTPHTAGPTGIEYVELAGSKEQIQKWIGPGAEKLPLRYVEGLPAIKAVGITTANGTIVLH